MELHGHAACARFAKPIRAATGGAAIMQACRAAGLSRGVSPVQGTSNCYYNVLRTPPFHESHQLSKAALRKEAPQAEYLGCCGWCARVSSPDVSPWKPAARL